MCSSAKVCKIATKIVKTVQKIGKNNKNQEWYTDNLVDFEKCCKMRVCLQSLASIQPRTGHIGFKSQQNGTQPPAGEPRLGWK